MSPARVNIGSVITGRVARVLVEEGDRVAAGQVLIELESSELMATLQQAEANEQHARVRVATVCGGRAGHCDRDPRPSTSNT